MIVECWKSKTTLVRDVSESVRLSSIPAVLLSAVGWCVFIGGLHSSTSSMSYLHGSWSAATITPLMYVAAVLHAGYTGKASILMGIFASILNTFFVVGMGFSVTVEGSSEIINDDYDDDLLPASSSVTVQRHVTDNREYTQRLPHVAVY